ncbi:MAG: ribonuclease R [Granulosicoccus sp.]|jgi:ribonuclease R
MKKKKKLKKIKMGQSPSAAELKHQIFKLLKSNPKKRLTAKQLIKKLNLDNSPDAVNDAMLKLAKEGKLYEIEPGRFRLDRFADTSSGKIKSRRKLHIGKADLTRSGAAYILVDDLEDDVYVAQRHTNGAMQGDQVQVSVHLPRGRRKPEGEVVKVLNRATEHFLGIIRIYEDYALMTPSMYQYEDLEIQVGLDDLKEAKDEDVVVVKVTKWGESFNFRSVGVVTSVLGEEGGSEIAMKSILINKGFELEFSEAVKRESEALNDELSEAEVARRRDMRDITTFTIDPDTARDFDDALSYRILEDGRKEIGVHIADVTHYVRPDTALDREALKRSTSVYLVDRVLPMLPEKISNELCSLRPNEDKCTFSAVFIFNEKGKVEERWFGKTLIHSDRRFSYEEAQEILEKGEGEYAEELLDLNKIAKKLQKKKFKDGAISFESPEVKFKLDEDGTPIDVFVKVRKDAHKLIEEFMLLANREVATYIVKKGKDGGGEIPFVYRVHDEPDPDKIAEFARFALELGFKMEMQTPKQIAESFLALDVAARENEALRMLQPIAIRSMAKAIYTTENIGHYGLAFDNYSHFTSPIRRYSDVLAHRLLEKNLEGAFRDDKGELEAKCRHISTQEKKAAEAERESVKYKQVEYSSNHIGEVFDAHISGMIDRGIFVQIDHSNAEGLIGFENFSESYDLGSGRLKAIGTKTGNVLKMGQKVRARIISTDLEKKQIELELVEEEN